MFRASSRSHNSAPTEQHPRPRCPGVLIRCPNSPGPKGRSTSTRGSPVRSARASRPHGSPPSPHPCRRPYVVLPPFLSFLSTPVTTTVCADDQPKMAPTTPHDYCSISERRQPTVPSAADHAVSFGRGAVMAPLPGDALSVVAPGRGHRHGPVQARHCRQSHNPPPAQTVIADHGYVSQAHEQEQVTPRRSRSANRLRARRPRPRRVRER